jgi:hypothetical protein
MLDGRVIGACMPRHRHREFLRFLKLIDQQTPASLDLAGVSATDGRSGARRPLAGGVGAGVRADGAVDPELGRAPITDSPKATTSCKL